MTESDDLLALMDELEEEERKTAAPSIIPEAPPTPVIEEKPPTPKVVVPPVEPAQDPAWVEERWLSRASKDEKEEAVKSLVAEMRRTKAKVSVLPRNGTILVAEASSKGEIVVYECEVQRRMTIKSG